MNEQPRRSQRPEAAELRVTPVAVAVPAPAAQEHHLGDRLAAFVDGELGHVARERVQAHLATCSGCLAEAEAERRLKSRLREVLPPEPSTVFMGRLLAIAAPAEHDGDDSDSDPPAPGSTGAGRGVRSLFGGSGSGSPFGASGGLGNGGLRGSSFGSGALGADHPVPGVDPRARRERYRGRERGDAGTERPIAARMRSGAGVGLLSVQPASAAPVPATSPAPRGRRLVFAAAGAFSVAAVTLSSALTGVTATSEAPSGVSPLSGTGNYAPAGGQLAFDNTGAETREGPAASRQVALAHPSSGPTVLPAGQFH